MSDFDFLRKHWERPLSDDDRRRMWAMLMGGDGGVDPTLALDFDLTNFSTSSGFLTPQNQRTVDANTITFARSSTAYRRNSSGLLESVASNIARLDHDSAGNPLGLLIEEARTNLLTRSEEFDHADWATPRVTITPNDAVAPDGETTADLCVPEAATGAKNITQTVSVSGNNNAFSVFAKAAGYSRVTLQSNTGAAVEFDLVAETATLEIGSGSGTIEDYGNGWFRCTMISTPGAGARAHDILVTNDSGATSFTGDGSSGIYIWGAQLEAGSFPTSYVKTTAASATRAASSNHILTADISGFDNANGTLYVEGRTALGSGTQVLAQFDDDSEDERIRIERNSSNEIHAIVTDGGVEQADLNLGTVADDTAFKAALSWQAGDFKGCLDGGTVQTDAAGTIPTVDRLRLGLDSADDHWNGTIKTVQVYNSIKDTQGLTA